MTTVASTVYPQMSHAPSGPYRSLRAQHMDKVQSRPFHVSAYTSSGKTPAPASPSGFPTASPARVQPWIPGVTSPEGVVLVTGLTAAMVGGGETVVRAAQFVASGVAAAVTAGFPGAAAYFAAHLGN